jgi:hypothetical protein
MPIIVVGMTTRDVDACAHPHASRGHLMNHASTIRLGLLALLACGVFTSAMAQDVPGHPRVNEVNQRVDNQQNRTANGIAQGTITGKQAAMTKSATPTSPSAKAPTKPNTTAI